MNRKKFYLIFFVIIALIVFSISAKQQREYSTHIEGVMDTTADITVITKNDGTKIIGEISELINRYDKMLSHTDRESEIYKLNCSKEEKVSDETYEIINKCGELFDDTCHAYDITVGTISELWNDAFKTGILPDHHTIEKKLESVGYDNLRLGDNVVKFDKDLKINLGSVAKGYTTDKIKEYLEQEKVKDALINFGGNIYAKGKNRNGELWNIGVQDPLNNDELLLSLKISDKFVITSGNYIRYADINQKRYHHIIDANTGYPVDNELNSVTIISDSGFCGDALSTSCFLIGFEASKTLLERYDVLAVFATKDNKIFYSRELENSMQKISENYEYIPF